MFKIDVASASPTLPTPAAAGSPGYFQERDPVAGTPGTNVSADFLNMVMMELVNLITAGGLSPSKTDATQVVQAVRAIGGGSVNLATKGHIKFASGFIVNWGTDTQSGSTGGQAVTFDLPFTNRILVTFATNNAGGPPSCFHGTVVDSSNLNGMTVWSATASGIAAAAGAEFHWLAFGV